MESTVRSVLFVCLGNICRSPTAEAVFRHQIRQLSMPVEVDSAGTHGYHIDSPPDERSIAAGENRGYSFEGIKCRKVNSQDFEKFDLVLAMDEVNLRNLQKDCPEDLHYKIHLFMSFSEIDEDEVPDPYYGGIKGFDYVLDLIEDASKGLIKHINSHG